MKVSLITNKLKHLRTRNKPCIFFMHIPKTGGTSVIHSLQKKYRFSFFKVNARDSLKAAKKFYGDEYISFEQCYHLRECVVVYAMESGYKCVAGHVPYSDNLAENSKKYLFITVLRDPVNRFMSKYFYNYHKNSSHFKFDMELSEYLNSDGAKYSGQEYIRYFSGEALHGAESARELVEKSKKNISRFDVIGTLENLTSFKNHLYKKTNIKLNIPHKNQTKNPKNHMTIDEELWEKIKEICKYDTEIYEYAKQYSKRSL